jgi:catechol 2,3-dioxygenase-like lactoylglutathione lyase family enzyme
VAIKFDQLNIVSHDLDATLSFYRRLGIDMADPIRSSSGKPFHTSSRNAARIWNQGWAREPELRGRVVIGLRVSDRAEVDRLYKECVTAGHRGLQPPFDAFWGARYAIVEDPDGLAVGLMSPVDSDHRNPPDIPD